MGKRSPDVIPAMLEARSREAAGPTAPAHGLFLHWIQFEPQLGVRIEDSG
jgi:tRNA U38,U39,U40 pseudouridine synthase TruA